MSGFLPKAGRSSGPAMLLTRDDLLLTDEPGRFDVPAIAALIQTTYWAGHRGVEQIIESLKHSTCLVLMRGGKTLGFVRAITDHSGELLSL